MCFKHGNLIKSYLSCKLRKFNYLYVYLTHLCCRAFPELCTVDQYRKVHFDPSSLNAAITYIDSTKISKLTNCSRPCSYVKYDLVPNLYSATVADWERS